MSGKLRKRVSDNEFSTTNYYALWHEHAHGTGDWEVQQGVQRPTIAEGKKAYLGLECKKRLKGGGVVKRFKG